MSELQKLRLKLDRDGDGTIDRTYDIYPVTGDVEISSQKDAMSIAPPGLSARENILLGVSGMQADISIPFAVWDDGVDRANGTHSSTVTTLTEQNRYLEDVMHAPDFSAGWKLDHLNGGSFNDDDVFVETVDVTAMSLDNRKWKPAQLRLRRGKSV